MPSIHFRTTVGAPPDAVYAALATQDGLAGNWTDQLEVPEQTGGVARFGFGPDWAKTLELRIDALEPGRLVQWTPVAGFRGWIGTSITWRLEPADDGGTVVHFNHGGWPEQAEGELAMCGYKWAMIMTVSPGRSPAASGPRTSRRASRCPGRRASIDVLDRLDHVGRSAPPPPKRSGTARPSAPDVVKSATDSRGIGGPPLPCRDRTAAHRRRATISA